MGTNTCGKLGTGSLGYFKFGTCAATEPDYVVTSILQRTATLSITQRAVTLSITE